MFGGMAFKIGMLAKKSTGGGADVTPNAVDWNDMTYNGISDLISPIPTKQITGINQTINLTITTDSPVSFFYYEVTSTPFYPDQSDAESGSIAYTAEFLGYGVLTYSFDAANPIQISVNNNDYITFAGIASGGIATITVTNDSDNSTELDTFTLS